MPAKGDPGLGTMTQKHYSLEGLFKIAICHHNFSSHWNASLTKMAFLPYASVRTLSGLTKSIFLPLTSAHLNLLLYARDSACILIVHRDNLGSVCSFKKAARQSVNTCTYNRFGFSVIFGFCVCEHKVLCRWCPFRTPAKIKI